MRALTRIALGTALLVASLVPSAQSRAAARRPLFSSNGCSITQPAVAFPNFNPLSGVDATFTGAFTVQCTLPTEITIALGTGTSGSFAQRTMSNGSATVGYNLYTTSAMNVVWGDGSGTTQTRTATSALGSTTSVAVYGAVPGAQVVPAGTYTDVVGITITLDY